LAGMQQGVGLFGGFFDCFSQISHLASHD
jgi:hypothetical protein